MPDPILTLLESPFRPSFPRESSFYRPELQRNIAYAQACMLDSLEHGEAPFLSHLLYTQCWKEGGGLRERGISASSAWLLAAQQVVLYEDLGVSAGMSERASLAGANGVSVVRRKLPPDVFRRLAFRPEVFVELSP
jgi:hypothetical protein